MDYVDETLVETLKATGVPRILTQRSDGTTVYVALDAAGELVEVVPTVGLVNGDGSR